MPHTRVNILTYDKMVLSFSLDLESHNNNYTPWTVCVRIWWAATAELLLMQDTSAKAETAVVASTQANEARPPLNIASPRINHNGGGDYSLFYYL